jgi:hypothetical protein
MPPTAVAVTCSPGVWQLFVGSDGTGSLRAADLHAALDIDVMLLDCARRMR